jgi:hypothetical protein
MLAGSVLLALSVLGGLIGVGVVVNALDIRDLDRDVVIEGARTRPVPGTLEFSVAERLDPSADDTMAVGVGVSIDRGPDSGARREAPRVPRCSVAQADGSETPLLGVPFDAELLHGDPDFEVVGSVRLAPGDYAATCEWPGEPSSAPDATFTVGRTLDADDGGGFVGPVLGLLAVVVVGGLLFVLGLILLIVGLVQRGRSRRPPSAPQLPSWPSPPGAG